ncbi:MAG: nuclear transport factor 2 family protein [Sphingobacterium sp.]|uniref:nuclear transport factor 2 family protein n=1 Tax=Sphingobacterium sp. JB170 TaxID=1434842 RepID=UPI00097E96B5|nr:nuclear transport factor 2 family protein [Sphingobacterium sp. JB170]SJN38735.1 hypothetical protein FM107_09765 [Sphingobacterium sp. JB170]
MKKSITTIAAAIIMITSFSAFAANHAKPVETVESAAIINAYIDATTLGAKEMNNLLFAEDFEYQNVANGDTFNKKVYTQFLENNQGVQYDCETSYQILDENAQACLAKTTMKFKNFTRVDYITLNHTTEGWEVSKVVTSYQD